MHYIKQESRAIAVGTARCRCIRILASFLQEWRVGRSPSSKVIDFATNRKRICDFLLVRHSNLAHILHRFRDIAAFLLTTSPIPP